MRKLDTRNHLRICFRPKGEDVDKPEGYGKLKLRRKIRNLLKRGIADFKFNVPE